MSRVVSKHLFNFPLNGVVDEDVIKDEMNYDKAALDAFMNCMTTCMEQEQKGQHDPDSNLVVANLMKELCATMFTSSTNHPRF